SILNCACLPISDSIESIGDTIKNSLILWSYGAGIGINFSSLRPQGSPLISKGGKSSGMVSFIEAIDAVANTIETGGQRRCLPAHSLVYTESGLVPICDIKVGEKVYTLNGLRKVSATYNQGKQLINRISTNAGNYYATNNHRVATLSPDNECIWKKVGELVVGDILIGFDKIVKGVKTELPKDFTQIRPKKSTTCMNIIIPKLDTEIAWLIGLIHGDGYIGDRRKLSYLSGASHISIAIHENDKKTISKARRVLEKFGVKAYAKKKKGEKCVIVIARSQRLVEYFWRYIKRPNDPIEIPYFILKSTEDIRAAYLAGLVDSDGSLKNRPPTMALTIYPKFAEQIQSLYFSLGIPTRLKINERKEDNWKTLYRVCLIGFRKYYNKTVGFYSTKGNIDKLKKNNNGFSVHKNIVTNQLRCRDYEHLWTTQLEDMQYESFIDCGGKTIGIPVFVKSVSTYEEMETFDIEIEDQHCFYADGILTHNSGCLALCRVSHPEIYKFIDAKIKDKTLTYFNLSVGIDNNFLNAVEENNGWNLTFAGQTVDTVKARDLWDKILESMIKSGEPGLINFNNLRKNNSFYFQQISATNLCGELPLPDWGMCCLGSLVLSKFIRGKQTDWIKLKNSIDIAVRFLDNVLDVNYYPIKHAEITTMESRRIGLGIMGLHDYLIKKEVRYGSEKSIGEIERLFKFIRDTAYVASIEIAKEKGAFPKYARSEYNKASFIKKLPAKIRLDIKEYGIRNCCLLSAQPTGTTSLIPEVSSGVEPIFALAYERKDRVSNRYYIHPEFRRCIENKDDNYEWLVDSSDLMPENHLEIQATIQKYIDNAVSKTINCPRGFTKNKLSKILSEYMRDIKGATVYVDGTKEGQVLNRITRKEAEECIKDGVVSNMTEQDVKCSRGTCEL
ncbi:MAG: LAGLIDADG family homing endonuclease, partial [Candidatus Hodarchaeales archaeon]